MAGRTVDSPKRLDRGIDESERLEHRRTYGQGGGWPSVFPLPRGLGSGRNGTPTAARRGKAKSHVELVSTRREASLQPSGRKGVRSRARGMLCDAALWQLHWMNGDGVDELRNRGYIPTLG
jgi:hypothetical protein